MRYLIMTTLLIFSSVSFGKDLGYGNYIKFAALAPPFSVDGNDQQRPSALKDRIQGGSVWGCVISVEISRPKVLELQILANYWSMDRRVVKLMVHFGTHEEAVAYKAKIESGNITFLALDRSPEYSFDDDINEVPANRLFYISKKNK